MRAFGEKTSRRTCDEESGHSAANRPLWCRARRARVGRRPVGLFPRWWQTRFWGELESGAVKHHRDAGSALAHDHLESRLHQFGLRAARNAPGVGDLTTRITVHDDAASLSFALSDEKPPSVDGFSISLKVGNGQYQLPYQPTQSVNQVIVAKDGKSYTITGNGQGTMPGQNGMRQITFGIHVTCP